MITKKLRILFIIGILAFSFSVKAKVMLEAKNLNISSTGSGIVIAQDPKAGSSVDEGTIINVTLQEASTSSQN